MYRKLPSSEKIELIKRIESGEKVAKVCREAGISRTIFYSWCKKYKSAAKRSKSLVLESRNPKGIKHWRRIKGKIEREIIKTALLKPQLSAKSIAKICNSSTHGVLNVLTRHGLNLKNMREAYIYRNGASLVRARSVDEKWVIIKRFENGEKASKLCKEYNISRTIFYRWLERYSVSRERETLASLRPKGENHWRYVDNAPKHILEIVIEHPDFSPNQIAKALSDKLGKPVLGVHGVYNFLKKMSLNTIYLRIQYAKVHAQTPEKQTEKNIFSIPSFTFDKFISFVPPPFRSGAQIIRNIIPLTILTIGTLSIIAFWTRLTLDASGLGNKIGIFFSFTALIFGMFFFLYSLKSYFMISIVLSFSRKEENKRQRKPFLDTLLSMFGIEITREEEKNEAREALLADLSKIRLERKPFVSIHLAMYNERRVIERLLTAATHLDYENFEVIVADDSTDKEAIAALEKWKDNPRVKILHRNTRDGFKGQALQNALLHTDKRAEFIMVFDADFIPYPDSASQFLKYFQSVIGSLDKEAIKNSNVAAVQGYQWHVLNKSENWITRGVRSEYAGSYVVERSAEEVYGGLKQISGSVYMVRKDVVEKIGWGRSITEDFEFTLKLYNEGFKVIYTPYIQAPSEAVSTVKRIIRQRMRWAEGHSFNIKRMFMSLMQNPKLTFTEKAEVVYLTPYYLQSAFFIAGTLSWFTAELIFRTRLPFWTEVWGWSLIFTNMFALPLMNLVGLFLEESSEKDYLGLLSFVGLSYLLAPFQGYAAIKGFVEEKEGPWFRTPKTGKITDSFAPGHVYRYVKSFFGIKDILSSPLSSLQRDISPYLALSTANNRFNSFAIRHVKRNRWISKSTLAIFLILIIMTNYLSFFTARTYAAAPNPTIEQQINIIDQNVTSSTTLTGGASGMVYLDTSKYTGATYYLEVVADVSSGGSGSVTFTYDAGSGSSPSGGSTTSISSITATTMTRYRSSSFSPSGGIVYISSVSGTGISIKSARIIIVQTDPTNIQNTETQVEVGNSESTTSTSDTHLASPKYWTYTSSNYDGTVTAYFEADLVNSGANNTSVSLYPSGSSCTSGQNLGTVTGSGTTWQRLRSTAITLTTGTTYMVCFSGAAGTASVSSAKVIIDQNNASGISKFETYEEYMNTDNSVTNPGDIQSLTTTNQGQLPATLARHAVVGALINGTQYVYALGGNTGGNGPTDQNKVYKAAIDANGDIGTFSSTNQGTLTSVLEGMSAVVATVGGTTYIYVLGGFNASSYTTTVQRATINSSTGDVGNFSTTSQTALPVSLYEEYSAIATSGTTTYIYTIGGYNGSAAISTVYRAALDSSGNVGSWSSTGQATLPVAEYAGASAQATIGSTQYVYAIGGNGTNGAHVYKGTLDSSGNVSTFTATSQTQLPTTETQADVEEFTIGSSSYLYTIGGLSNGGTNANTTVYKSTLDSSGNVGSWSTTNQPTLSTGFFRGDSYGLTLGNFNYIYTLGGASKNSNGNNISTVNKGLVFNSYNYFGYQNLYESGNWAAATFNYYFESTLKGTTTTGAEQIHDIASSNTLGNITNSSTSTFSLVRSASISPVNAKEYDSEIQSANSTNAWLVIDVTSLQTPENVLLYLPFLLFMPKIVQEIKKYRERKRKLLMGIIIQGRKSKYVSFIQRIYNIRKPT